MEVSEFIGKVLTGVDITDDEVRFVDNEGKKYLFYHSQDCCESVEIDKVCGQIEDLIGYSIVEAEEEVYDNEKPNGETEPYGGWGDSFTWTIHRFRTERGYLEIRWLGESNGYYDESVRLEEITDE